jgi:hypothetical protein
MNWIEEHQSKNEGRLPPIPRHLTTGFVGGVISKETRPLIPSGQFWNGLSPSQQKQWREMVEWLGEDPEDYLTKMRAMFPADPPNKYRR